MITLMFALSACEGPATPTAPAAPTPAAAPAPAAPPPVPPAPLTRIAKVLEVKETEKYTILHMDACGADAWVAGPKTPGLAVDQMLEMPEGTAIENFEAKELGRTFEVMLLVDWLKETKVDPKCPKPHSASGGEPPKLDDIVGIVKESLESGGYRYARVDVCGVERWVAGPKVPLKVGDVLKGGLSNEMTNFTSPSLGKTFETIAFLHHISIASAPPECSKAKN